MLARWSQSIAQKIQKGAQSVSTWKQSVRERTLKQTEETPGSLIQDSVPSL